MSIICEVGQARLTGLKATYVPAGWLVPKHPMLRPLFNQFLIEVHEAGIRDKLDRKYVPLPRNICQGDNSISKVDFNSVKFMFFVLLSGAILAVILASVEKAYA